MTTPLAATQRVLHTYRSMTRMLQHLPESKAEGFRKEMRSKFREPVASQDDLDDRIRVAGEKIAFLRIITPKTPASSTTNDEDSSGRWIYRNGEKFKDVNGTTTDANGRVVSSFHGYNFDPCQVKRHKQGLKRAGFVNNLHAKGMF